MIYRNGPRFGPQGGPEGDPHEEITMRRCDVCRVRVREFSMKHYREAGMMVCQDCVPQCDKDEAEGIEEANK